MPLYVVEATAQRLNHVVDESDETVEKLYQAGPAVDFAMVLEFTYRATLSELGGLHKM